MRSTLRVIDAISEWSGKVSSFLIYPGIFLLVYEVFLRYVFNSPTIWGYGTTQRLFAFFFVIGGAYVLRYGAHVSMNLVYNRLSTRKRAIMNVITFPVFFIFCGVLLWYGVDFAWTSLSQLERCHTPLNAPVYPIKMAVPLAALLIVLQGLAKFVRDVFTATSGRQYEY